MFAVENDGRQCQKLVLRGTVPINYNGSSYNIPVDIWIPPEYPATPPEAYVMPTAGMAIKPRHQHVGSDGKCYFPYLHSWNHSCNLLNLVQTVQVCFGADPPVYAKPQPQPAQQYQQPTQPYQQLVQPSAAVYARSHSHPDFQQPPAGGHQQLATGGYQQPHTQPAVGYQSPGVESMCAEVKRTVQASGGHLSVLSRNWRVCGCRLISVSFTVSGYDRR